VLKKTITYEDFNGETISEDFFFHLSKAELVELEMSHKGGLSESMKRIIAAEDNASLIKEFKNLILSAYGKRSDDGRQFIKNQELRDEFVSTEAYSALFMELVTDTNAAIEFVQGVIPKGLADEAAEVVNIGGDQPVTPIPRSPEVITRSDLARMSAADVATLGERIQKGEVVIQEM
jgi:hypothetical protein